MAEQRHLDNAPIVEALIDIQVTLPKEITVSNLQEIHPLILEKYPKEVDRIKGSFEIKVDKSQSTTTKDEFTHYGYAYISSDGLQIVQVRLDGFTFSRLKPYESWENLREEAKEIWDLYLKIASPETVTRIALRVINKLEVPLSLKNFKDYIAAPPIIPSNLPQGLSSFLTRNVVPVPELNATVIITQSYEPVANEKFVPIILDIDVFSIGQLKIDNQKMWEILDNLRILKNKFFFESVTEEMIKLCL